MWAKFSQVQKEEYKRLILAFASLTDMFAQKSTEEGKNATPIINSKFQETAFQRAFHATAEDIGNTSYDASVQKDGEKYLVGIKTFGISSGDQKVAQFKANHDEWAKIIDEIKSNATGKTKVEIDQINNNLYLQLATKIAKIRNARIESSKANLKGFMVENGDDHIHSVYHVLMPSGKNEAPMIYVGETSYEEIDIEKLEILGCTGGNNPTNFAFSDGKHRYKYTSADSQLYMTFDNRNIVCDKWNVKYADDASAIFSKIADEVYPTAEEVDNQVAVTDSKGPDVSESYCWTIWNKDKNVELYSGFNSFYATGSKLGRTQRKQKIEKICQDYEACVKPELLLKIKNGLMDYLLQPATSMEEKTQKVKLREELICLVKETGYATFEECVCKLLYRPMDELYIPIPDSAQFHKNHPNFFGPSFGELQPGTSKLVLAKESRRFNLIFDPSGDSLPAYITQDNGKAIESAEKQSYLGEWILRGVFQLDAYEPLTTKKLMDLNINGLRFTRYKESDDIHLEFIWIDEDNPPNGFISKK